jgi:probable O-glycosylation ligase (exosortase A-associated)
MASIQNYEEDSSAMGRLAAWWVAWGIAKDHLFGAGYGIAYPHLFAMYSPIPSNPVVAHSIYFQILGNHGFVGLGLFLALWVSTWALTAKIRKTALQRPETKWCHDLASMVQVAFVGYAVGGAFLNLAYFDLPYNLMVAVVLTHVWMKTRAWEREPVYKPGRWTLPGLAAPSAAQPASRQATARR